MCSFRQYGQRSTCPAHVWQSMCPQPSSATSTRRWKQIWHVIFRSASSALFFARDASMQSVSKSDFACDRGSGQMSRRTWRRRCSRTTSAPPTCPHSDWSDSWGHRAVTQGSHLGELRLQPQVALEQLLRLEANGHAGLAQNAGDGIDQLAAASCHGARPRSSRWR